MKIAGFIWPESVIDKLAWKHDVTADEVEEVFDNRPRIHFIQKGHIQNEDMYTARGRSNGGRYLTIFLFTRKIRKRSLFLLVIWKKRRRQNMSRKDKDPIPENFSTLDEAAEFWDTHSLEDYPEYLTEINDVEVDIKEKRVSMSIAVYLDKQARKIARQEGISTETLLNLWIREKIEEYELTHAPKSVAA